LGVTRYDFLIEGQLRQFYVICFNISYNLWVKGWSMSQRR
jgi:hypothetical protein